MIDLVNNLLISVLALIGLIVLVAMGKVDSAVALPVIVGLAGVHIGANISTPPSTPTPPRPPSPPTAV